MAGIVTSRKMALVVLLFLSLFALPVEQKVSSAGQRTPLVWLFQSTAAASLSVAPCMGSSSCSSGLRSAGPGGRSPLWWMRRR